MPDIYNPSEIDRAINAYSEREKELLRKAIAFDIKQAIIDENSSGKGAGSVHASYKYLEVMQDAGLAEKSPRPNKTCHTLTPQAREFCKITLNLTDSALEQMAQNWHKDPWGNTRD